ncbi:MAG: hypothetical protein GEV11_02350 [Streptosporangiales bacterium]|nr:hypothetical protein [Streptosporangiales bacterium]
MDQTPLCPKCRADMETFERNGVVIEQCGDCKGVFLDRGELERLIDAESEYLANLPIDGETAADGYKGKHRRGIMHEIFQGAAAG